MLLLRLLFLFLSAVFSHEGNPLELVTDNASQFVSGHFLQTEISNTTVALSINL